MNIFIESRIMGRVIGITVLLYAGFLEAQPAYSPGSEFRDCSNCPLMVVIPSGIFLMGSTSSEKGREDFEGPQHSVTISKPLAVGKFEVTFDEWDYCVKDGGCNGYESVPNDGDELELYQEELECLEGKRCNSHSPYDEEWGRGTLPVINVSWDDVKAYVLWLSKKTGKKYRLLSEAEWEYAARAGTTTSYYWGESLSELCAYANGFDRKGQNAFGYSANLECDDREVFTSNVGQYDANAFGLHDMTGNVWEWVEDCWHESYHEAPSDGRAITEGFCWHRVIRGGAWDSAPRYLRSAARNQYSRDLRYNFIGFRVVRSVSE